MKILQSVMNMCTELSGCAKYTGIACDGNKIYVSEPNCKRIHTYNMSMEPISCIETSRGYKSICYDEKSKCFWGYSEQFYERIIKLNTCFEEIGYISVNTKCEVRGAIVGISANCCDCSLLLAYSDGIVELSKETGIITRVISKNSARRYTAVGGECEYYAYAYEKSFAQCLEINTIEDAPILKCYLEESYWIEAIAIRENCIYLLVKMCNTTYIMMFLLSEVNCCPPPCPHPCPPPCPHPCPPPCPHPCPPPCPHPCPPPCPHPCPPPYPHPCPPVRCWEDLCAVIHSIALGEAALSHILNAEGEKIQKGVKVSESVEELLKLNESVRRTIDKVAKLEYVLYSKLEAVKDMCPEIFCKCTDGEHECCCNPNCDCDCEHEHHDCNDRHNHGFDFDFNDMFGKELQED